MTKIDADILVIADLSEFVQTQLDARFRTHKLYQATDPDAMLAEIGPRIRGVAAGAHRNVDADLMDRLPNLEIISNFGVGYDNVDAKSAGARGIIVTNTPDVLSEEVADTAIGLMINTVRELPQAEQFLRAGKWTSGNYPLTQNTLREKRLGIAGLGRIGKAIAKRAESFGLSISYYGRSDQKIDYTFHDSLKSLAENVDIIISVLPGGEATSKAYNKDVFKALGPEGTFINIGRGSTVDEEALITALKTGTIRSAGLDVFDHEPHVPEALMALPNAVLLPHVGSASIYTRNAMGQLLVDNHTNWFENGKPLTPVAETPFPAK